MSQILKFDSLFKDQNHTYGPLYSKLQSQPPINTTVNVPTNLFVFY